MDFLKFKALEYGMAFVIAPLAVFFMQALKRYSAWVDAQGPWIKRAFVTVTVFVFVLLAQVTGVDFGVAKDAESLDFIADLDKNAVKTAVGAGLAFFLHAVKKARRG